jgi:hypothetical protein
VVRRARLAALALVLTAGGACVDDAIPPRPVDSPDAPGPHQLASAPGCMSIDLVVSDGTVYWTEQGPGLVKSVGKSGGGSQTIAAGQDKPGAIAVDAASVFWVAGGGKTIVKKPLAGTSSTILVRATNTEEILGGENQINALLVSGTDLFFGRFNLVAKVSTSGALPNMPKVIMLSPESDRGRPSAFALDPTHLYQTENVHWAISRETTDGLQDGLVEAGGRQTLAPDRIAVSQSEELLLDTIAVVDGNVIWAVGPNIKTKPVDANENVPEAIVTTSRGGNAITGFVVSSGVVYFGEAVDDNIEKAPLATGEVTLIAGNQQAPSQFAADDDNIYWRTADCKVMRMAK